MRQKQQEARTSFQLVCSRGGKESFGLSVSAFNPKHALTLAKRIMEGSGYTVYPLNKKEQ